MEKNESHADVSNGNSHENGESGSAKNNSARKTAKQRRFQKDTIIYMNLDRENNVKVFLVSIFPSVNVPFTFLQKYDWMCKF